MGAGLDNTLGATFIGMVIAAALFGITCSQTYFYFGSNTRESKDGTVLASMVTFVVIMDFVHQIAISSWLYTYCVTEFGNTAALSTLPWGFYGMVFPTLFVTFMVQGFYVWRIWQLSGKSWVLAGFIELCSIAQAGSLIYYIVATIVTVTSAEQLTTELQKYVILVNGLGAGTDILITLAMLALLKQSRTAIKRTNRLIRTITILSVTTGMASTLCAVGVLSMAVAFPGQQIMMAFYFMLTKVYTNSFLGTLNVRDHLREASERAKWISTASFMFTRSRDNNAATTNGPVRTTQPAHTVHELGDLKQDPLHSQEETGDDEHAHISVKIDRAADCTQ
ncbi:hypothetical protein BD626DRAFT_490179 [Schizophyllum amplum]|uniref:DUF6534 domain-containing protein n=1 Tax=Schizophyllum amplum TaxID=97359 RepID=A0A550CJ74_9AGAR|nr:hypothetical protein BD626DRAFT_490179 [Auriculariopsis ampla]